MVVHHIFPPFHARFVQFHPLKWHSHISMRAELYGCPIKVRVGITVPSHALLPGDNEKYNLLARIKKCMLRQAINTLIVRGWADRVGECVRRGEMSCLYLARLVDVTNNIREGLAIGSFIFMA